MRSYKRLSEKTKRLILCAVLYAALAAFAISLFAFNANYQKIYSSPEVDNASIDFSGVDIPTRDVACNLAGEWEFFYNKWIVTDDYSGEPDGNIDMPSLWTWKSFGGNKLPRSGYGSYRLTALNVQSGINVIVYRHYANCAYRSFVNGVLNNASGRLSKDPPETEITGRTDYSKPYLTDGGPLEIVIEVSASDDGGFNAAPWLAATATGVSYGNSLRSFNYIALGITAAAVAVSILTFAFFAFRRDVTVPAFMIALFMHFLSSKDMLFVFRWQITASMISGLFTAVAAMVFLILHLKRCGAEFKKIPVLISLAAAAALIVFIFVFYGTPLAPVSGYLLLAISCAYLVPAMLNKKFTTVQRGIYGVLYIALSSVFLFELSDALGLLTFGTEFIFTVVLMLIIACFAALWMWKMAKSAHEAIRVSELECQLHSLQNQALKAQIKPHFIFNSLTAIQARYRDGLAEGDKSLESFARHLRLICDSDAEESVPFEDEVRNVMNYFELENLRHGGKLNLLLDLNFTDFSVPVLSLQPLVENALRHGGLREIADGCVVLSSEKTDEAIKICVSDNGCGFDVSATGEGVGLSNVRKRFENAGAKLNVESRVGGGTRVTVEIPLE